MKNTLHDDGGLSPVEQRHTSEDGLPVVCGECKHWSRTDGYKWGKCGCPVPWWSESSSPIIYPGDSSAANCSCYTRRDEQQATEVEVDANRPLSAGTLISYLDVMATVVQDDGGPELLVSVDGVQQLWSWFFDGFTCKVVKRA